MSAGQLRHRVYFTPLMQSDINVYADEIDVSDHIKYTGIGNLRRSIDASDYDVGVFVFSDVELVGVNENGYFNENDYRSVFPSIRDRCKVRVVFSKIEMVRDLDGTVISEVETVQSIFRGLLNEEATRLDITNETIRFKILSRDSVLRTTKISSGVITAGMTVKQSLEAILNVPRITSVLNFDANDITPDYDFVIDSGTWFNNKSVTEGVNKLLFASNSVLLINDAGDIVVRSRVPDESKPVLNLYGKNDIHYRENIIDITSYNTGKQRQFTSVTINDTERNNADYVQAFGLRNKKFKLEFVTSEPTEAAIADIIVDEFKTAKIELNIKVATDIAKNVELLDRVSVSYPLRAKPPAGAFLPVIGITMIGETDQPLPHIFGAISIEPRLAFKVIEIEDNPDRFTSVLKLRQIGKDLDDGIFDTPGSCLVGYAVIGLSAICGEGDPCEGYNPSIIGAAQVGCTLIA